MARIQAGQGENHAPIQAFVPPGLGTNLTNARVTFGFSSIPIASWPARMMLARSRFDVVKCRVGLKALWHYRREWNPAAEVFRPNPVHSR